MKHQLFFLPLLVCFLFATACQRGTTKGTSASTTSANDIKIACVGNSITYGHGIDNRERKSYPAQLDSLLGAGYNVQNFGVSGRTLLKKGDYPYWNEAAFTDAKAFQPDIVVIKLGTNDTKPQNWTYADEFVPNYVELVKTFQQLDSKPTVFICRPVPAFEVRWGIDGTIVKNELLPKIDAIAKETGAKIINLYDPFVDKQAYFPDAIHPNTEGAGEIAKLVKAEVQKVKVKKK